MKIVVIKDVLTKLTSHMHYMRTSLIFVLRQLKKDDTMLTKGVQVTGGVNTILSSYKISDTRYARLSVIEMCYLSR